MHPTTHNGPRYLARLFLLAPWEVFGGIAALLIGVIGATLICYPDPYAVSKSYAQVSKLAPAPVIGLGAFLPALWFLLTAGHRSAQYALALLGLWVLLMCMCSVASVGLSAGSLLYLTLTLLTGWAFFRSGGIHRRSP